MTLDSPVTDLKGVGEAVAQKFAVLGIATVAQLIDYYPRRYEDYSTLITTDKLLPGRVTIRAKISNAKNRYVRRGMIITEATASDQHDSVRLVWFNQSYREGSFKDGSEYFISGNYELRYQRFAITNPSTELVSEFPLNTARIIPVYGETKGLTSRVIRRALKQALPLISGLQETLPARVIKVEGLVSRSTALQTIHFPESSEALEAARTRLGFEEVFRLTLAGLLNKRENQSERTLSVPYNEKLAVQFSKSLPFKLTDDQRKVVMRIYKDLEKPQPMSRLVEGDVGSGKTVVAVMAALMALEQGWQVALMAPTELLARQHADTIFKLLEPVGLEHLVGFLVGSLKPAQKAAAHSAIASGKARFIIGTQALIQDKVNMHKLALIVIDEQHRFGVEQRKKLLKKAGHMPHLLSLTATPIPRSLALALYGELAISELTIKPAGRQPVITQITSPNSRAQLYVKIDKLLADGQQMFVVCPLITDSTTLDADSVEKVYKQLSTKDFKHRRVGLLHGQLKPAERQAVMEQFVRHELDILVSTTVIEVGVDIPNATVMLIESAERFGLAQLHQLRGRVGRGQQQGYCYLMLSDSKPPSRRLRALESSNNGFKLAELDLKIRGPGAFVIGTLQHGHMAALRVADLSDERQVRAARNAAAKFLDEEKLEDYPELGGIISSLREAVYVD